MFAAAVMIQTLWFSTFLVSSIALQAPSTNQQTHLKTNGQTQSDSDWDFMNKTFVDDFIFGHLTCNSEEYGTYFKAMKKSHTGFSLKSLSLPANAKILFFGTSYLHEIVQNIVVANSDILIKNGHFGGLEGASLPDDVSWNIPGYDTTWNFTNGASIRELQNVQQYQQYSTGWLEALTEQSTFQFDVAFFMNPHPYCDFFPANDGSDYCKCYYSCLNVSTDCFVGCNAQFDGNLKGPREDAAPLFDVLKKALNGNVYEVEAWGIEPRTVFHADADHTVTTFPLLVRAACNHEDNCTHSALPTGHQCQPGLLTTVAGTVMEKVKAVVG